jgi:hypothetical protein
MGGAAARGIAGETSSAGAAGRAAGVVVDQPYDGISQGVSSQQFPDQPPYSAFQYDDFFINQPYRIGSILAMGVEQGNPGMNLSVKGEIWSGLPNQGGVVVLGSLSGTEDPGGRVNLDFGNQVLPPGNYWLRAYVVRSLAGGQWYWLQTTPVRGMEEHFHNPGGAYGFGPNPVPGSVVFGQPRDMTFTIFGEPDTPPPPQACIPASGDLNGDGLVNSADSQGFIQCVTDGGHGPGCAEGDFNDDGAAGLEDVTGMITALLSGGPASSRVYWGNTMPTHPQSGQPLTFADLRNQPIPADFFGPGSQPFAGQIILGGVVFSPGVSGNADTMVRWPEDPVFPAGPLPVTAAPVCVELSVLQLRSVSPIEVMVNGQPTLWEVEVGLSILPGPPGMMTATKTHPNGGTFDAMLPVLPRFVFTQVGVADVRILDWGVEGIPPILFQTAQAPWVHGVDPALGIVVPSGTNFVPGVEQEPVTGVQTPRATTYADSPAPTTFSHTMWSPWNINPQGELSVTEVPSPEPCPPPALKDHTITATWSEPHCGIANIKILKNGVLLIEQNYPCPDTATLTTTDALGPSDEILTIVTTCPPHDDATLCCFPVTDDVCSGPIQGATYLCVADAQRTDKESRTLTCPCALPSSQWSATFAGQGKVTPASHTGATYPLKADHESTPIDDVTIDRSHIDGDGDVSKSKSKLTVVMVDMKLHRPKVIDPSDSEVADADELDKGGQTWENLDNDDRDDKLDVDDDNVSAVFGGEDEMCQVRLRLKPKELKDIPCGSASLEVTAGETTVRVWKQSNKVVAYGSGDPIGLAEFYATDPDPDFIHYRLFVEGIEAHTSPRQAKFKMHYDQVQCKDEVALTVLGLEKLEWIGRVNGYTAGSFLHNSDTLDADPNFTADPPGGQRVFACARMTSSDPGVAREVVDPKITLTVAPVENVDLYLKSYDCDDPSGETTYLDPNDAGGGAAGNYFGTTIPYTADEDNRGTVGGKKAGRFVKLAYPWTNDEDADQVLKLSFPAGTSEKQATFQTSLFAGDSYRITANGDKDFLLLLRNKDAEDGFKIVDPNLPAGNREIKKPAKYASKVLTVWRLLHVEVDSMVAVPNPPDAGNNFIITTATGIRNGTTEVTVAAALNDGSPDLDDGAPRNGRFDRGSADIGAGGGVVSISPITGNGDNFIRHTGAIAFPFAVSKAGQADATGNVTALAGNTFTLNVTGGALVDEHNGGSLAMAGVDMAIAAVNVAAGEVTVAAHNIPVRIHDDDDDDVLDAGAVDFTGVAAPYAPAYILPQADGGSNTANNTHNIAFLANGNGAALNALMQQATPAAFERDEFWVAYLANSFQGPATSDRDPQVGEAGDGGVTRSTVDNNVVAVGGDASWVHRETCRDRLANDNPPAAAGLPTRTAPHELGHQLGLDHLAGTLMNSSLQTVPANQGFAAQHLHLLRCRVRSPGQ